MTAVFGLLSMLLGALMVLAPAGAGADQPAQPGALAAECRTALGVSEDTLVYGAKWEAEGTYESLAGFSATMTWTEDEDSTLFEFSDASDLVYVLAVKQASDPLYLATWADGVYAGRYDYSNAKPTPDGDFSHVTICGYDKTPPPPPVTGALVVEKVVTGEPAGGEAFGFAVSCTDQGVPVELDGATFTLGAGEQRTVGDLPVGATCSVTETDVQGADATTIRVDGGTAVSGTTVGFAIDDGTTEVLVTNHFDESPPPQGASLTVEKVVAGEDVPDTWAFGFEVEGPDVDEVVGVTDEAPTATIGDLASGTYTVTEVPEQGDLSALTGVSCVAGTETLDVDVDLVGRTASVDLAEGAAVTCTFTNAYAEVLPDDVTPADETPDDESPEVAPTTPPAPVTIPPAPAATPPAAEVLGDTVIRELPYTGSGTRNLAILGTALLAAGAALVTSSNRRLARLR